MKPLVLAALAALAFNAGACGVCIDDKIASCYDHALITRAKQSGHAVAFFAITGDLVRSGETKAAVLAAIGAVPGALRGSARVSLENAALSFAFDPARTTAERARTDLARRLPKGLDLAWLRTL